jgi:hypothetical protein
LQEVDGIIDIETDFENRVCSFKVADPGVDYQTELARLAEKNTHIAGYEIQ